MAKFEIKKSYNGTYYYRLKATGNNKIILHGENYNSRSACLNGIASVRENAPFDSRYERGIARNGEYYFNLMAWNNETIGTSETYKEAVDRDHAIELVKTQAPSADFEDLT